MGTQADEFGNYFLKIPGSQIMFTCHLDSCTNRYERVSHVMDDRWIKTDGSTILGADDKAGMTVLLYMMEKNIPGLYYFFVGDEVGGVGSCALSIHRDFSRYKMCVSFDRRGYGSVITEQMFGPCCSNRFALALSTALNNTNPGFDFAPDPAGIFTDSIRDTHSHAGAWE